MCLARGPRPSALASSTLPCTTSRRTDTTPPASAISSAALGIAKGSIFQHFGSKDGLFFEVYKRAVRSFPKYLDAPADVRAAGFFDILYYWLVRTEHLPA